MQHLNILGFNKNDSFDNLMRDVFREVKEKKAIDSAIQSTKEAFPTEPPKKLEYDPVNKPKHYMLLPEKDIEVRDLMEALADELSSLNYSGMFVSDYIQMMQYLLRFHKKNGAEDLNKAKWYLNKLVKV